MPHVLVDLQKEKSPSYSI